MKTFSFKVDPLRNEEYLEVYLKGPQILNHPYLNKANSFTDEERISLNIVGLLRYEVTSIEIQEERAYEAYLRKTSDVEKYIYLQGLLNRNEILFYKLLVDHLPEMLPIVYTPTVGQACMDYSHITRRYRGAAINPKNIYAINQIFHNVTQQEISLIVVTDGERILGLGDLGSDGMGIPIGKVNLYVAAGGLHPKACLPVILDVGTNNERLLNDPMYLGFRHERYTGSEYDEFLEKFVLGVRRNFPNALLQWEDFAKHKAFMLLDRYRERITSFDDDIQGTGTVALSSLITAMKIKKSSFRDQRFVVVGMGQAGSGIALNILSMLMEEGLTQDEAVQRIFAVDYYGLINDSMHELEDQMKIFAQKKENLQGWKLENENTISLKDTIRNSKATVLIGVTGKQGLFDNEIINMMASHTERPVIMALSNPTSQSECTPNTVVEMTKGKALMAFGSPFPEIKSQYGEFQYSQCNNMYVFPGIGLGAIISKATRITDSMFLRVGKELSSMITEEQMKKGLLLPSLDDIRHVSYRVALAVAIEARELGLGRIATDEQLSEDIKRAQWQPRYLPYRPG